MLFHFQCLDELFPKMIGEYIYYVFVMGHLGSIIPPVLYRISLSADERPMIETCVTLYTPLSDGYISCTLPVFRQPRPGPRTGVESKYLIVLVSPL